MRKTEDYIERRAVELGEFIAQNKATVRRAAKEFGISKSTVHKDVSERLIKIDPQLYKEVHSVLETNKAERHIRGGDATKRKYMKKKAAQEQNSPVRTYSRGSGGGFGRMK